METFEKLPPEFKAKWIAALRSGEYKQGQGYLYNPTNDSYCCLGVAGELCGLNKDQLKYKGYYSSESFESLPSLLVSQHGAGAPNILAKMNDGRFNPQKSFFEIADWIEENL